MNLLLILEEYISFIGSRKRISFLRQYVNPKPNDDLTMNIICQNNGSKDHDRDNAVFVNSTHLQ
jgi:hypothetical protein